MKFGGNAIVFTLYFSHNIGTVSLNLHSESFKRPFQNIMVSTSNIFSVILQHLPVVLNANRNVFQKSFLCFRDIFYVFDVFCTATQSHVFIIVWSREARACDFKYDGTVKSKLSKLGFITVLLPFDCFRLTRGNILLWRHLDARWPLHFYFSWCYVSVVVYWSVKLL